MEPRLLQWGDGKLQRSLDRFGRRDRPLRVERFTRPDQFRIGLPNTSARATSLTAMIAGCVMRRWVVMA